MSWLGIMVAVFLVPLVIAWYMVGKWDKGNDVPFDEGMNALGNAVNHARHL